MNSKLVSLVLFVALAGCAADSGSGTTVTRNGLEITETGDLATGTFNVDGIDIRFSSEMLTATVLDLVIEHSGMTLSYTADFSTGVAEFDGFVTATGEETQMLAEDRAILEALAHELDELGEDVSMPVDKLRGFANVWSEFPTSMALQGHPPVEPDAARHREDKWYEPWNGVQICDHLNSYFTERASHDCDEGGYWSDQNTLDRPYVSWHGSCGGDGTNYYLNGWQCSSHDHRTDIEYAYGDCLGRCGGGCGSSGTFTVQCLNHDQCVRDADHIIVSWYCDDEFLGTTDDWSFAPNC